MGAEPYGGSCDSRPLWPQQQLGGTDRGLTAAARHDKAGGRDAVPLGRTSLRISEMAQRRGSQMLACFFVCFCIFRMT